MVSILHAARDIGRVRDISTVLVRHGFGEIVRRIGLGRPKRREASSDPSALGTSPEEEALGAREKQEISLAVRVRLVLEDLGPSFVKLGQIASTRPDILPMDVITELKKLQDSVAPVPFEQIRQQVELSLGAELPDVFEEVSEVPLAAASIAQVHRARLRTPNGPADVAVKVQRPGIAETIASDLDILHGLAALVERAIPESRTYSPVGLVRQFDRAINDELDFTAEAENARRFAENFKGFRTIRFPRVYDEASSKRVLTLEYLEGRKIDDAVAAGYSGKALARSALEIMVKQIFEDGFFHADPHPGNVLVLGEPEQPVLALLDLGMVGRLSPRMRDLTIDVMVGAVRRDYDAIADAIVAISTPTKKFEMTAFRSEVATLAERYLGKQLKDIVLASLIRDLAACASKYGLEIPTDFLLVGKALMTVEGIGKEIDPELDVLEEARPFFMALLRKRYSPERIGNELLRRLEKLSDASYHMPQQIQEVLEDLRLGRLHIRSEDPVLARSSDRLGRRLFSGLVAGSLLLSGTLLVIADYVRLGAALLSLALLLVLAHAARDAYVGFRERR
ncbi:MAG TPA: AarF/UbiB family protein [Polyangiaceae bacterium]